MSLNRGFASAVLAIILGFGGAGIAAQQEESDPPTPTPAPTPETPAEAEPSEKSKIPFALYVYAAAGEFGADPLNTSIQTTVSQSSENELDLEDFFGARAAIGWQLPNKKGAFRLQFQGFREDSYAFSAVGERAALPVGSVGNTVVEVLPWWTVNITNGELVASRNPPQWDLTNDTNGDLLVNKLEVVPGAADITNTRSVADDLQNNAVHTELVYGRRFGKRKFSGHWWAGLRQFTYEGNILAGAWLNVSGTPETGYSDGSTLRLLNFAQETDGLGPTGALEGRAHLFDSALTFYLQAQAAFIVADLKTDTGEFFTAVSTQTPPLVTQVLQARLIEDRSKSIWNTTGELGMRLDLKNGLTFDLAYQIQGYLDAVIMPSRIQIPATPGQALQGTSAIYATQDLVIDGWRIGAGFQF